MDTMEHIPFAPAEEIFDRLEKVASYAALSPDERAIYDAQLKRARDLQNSYDYAITKGLNEGRAEGRAEEREFSIRKMASFGISVEDIADAYDMPIPQVKSILLQN